MRMVGDQYFTPPQQVYAVLPEIGRRLLDCKGKIVEPSAGQGMVLRCLQDFGVPADQMLGLEQDPALAAQAAGYGLDVARVPDTLQIQLRGGISAVVGNPPYLHAAAFVKWGLATVDPGGFVAFLLRSGFVGSLKRAAMLRRCKPSVHALPARPSFVHKWRQRADGSFEKSTTDHYTYAWIVFEKPATEGRFTVLHDQPHDVAEQLRLQGLPIPARLHWQYTPPQIAPDGETLVAHSWTPT